MKSRERVKIALSHKQPDKLPVDIGSTSSTGIHVRNVYLIRQRLGLDKPRTPVKVIDPYSMLGEIADDLKEAIGIDLTMLNGKYNFFGFENEGWKEWEMPDGTPVLVPKLFNTKINQDGSIYQYPKGDTSIQPSAKMPKNGFFFDAIIRKKEVKEEDLDPNYNLEEFDVITDNDLKYLAQTTEFLYNKTNYAIMGMIGCGSSFGNIALVPGMSLKEPKGIRDLEEWYISTYTRRDFIKKIFEGQCDIALKNFKRIFDAIGNKIEAILSTGNDFGMQSGLFISKEDYRQLYKPFHTIVNKWIHDNTEWKSMVHSCGSVYKLIPDLIEAGFDILNPVQISAVDMEPTVLKRDFGKDIVFWGGGLNTQKTLMFGSPSQVMDEVKKLIDIFYKDGGYIFATIHNIQANVPLDNIMAMIKIIQEIKK